MMAAGNGRIEIVRELLKHSPNKALKNIFGKTAYDMASGSNKEEIKALLR